MDGCISHLGLSLDPADVVIFLKCIPNIRFRGTAYRVLVFRQDRLKSLMEFVDIDDNSSFPFAVYATRGLPPPRLILQLPGLLD